MQKYCTVIILFYTNKITLKGVSYSGPLKIYNPIYHIIIIILKTLYLIYIIHTVDEPIILDLNVIKSSHK